MVSRFASISIYSRVAVVASRNREWTPINANEDSPRVRSGFFPGLRSLQRSSYSREYGRSSSEANAATQNDRDLRRLSLPSVNTSRLGTVKTLYPAANDGDSEQSTSPMPIRGNRYVSIAINLGFKPSQTAQLGVLKYRAHIG